MERSWKKKFSTWPAPPRRNSKLSPRLNTPFAKLAAILSSAIVITNIFRRVQRLRHRRKRSSPARNNYCHSEQSRGIALQKSHLILRDYSTSLCYAQDYCGFDIVTPSILSVSAAVSV